MAIILIQAARPIDSISSAFSAPLYSNAHPKSTWWSYVRYYAAWYHIESTIARCRPAISPHIHSRNHVYYWWRTMRYVFRIIIIISDRVYCRRVWMTANPKTLAAPLASQWYSNIHIQTKTQKYTANAQQHSPIYKVAMCARLWRSAGVDSREHLDFEFA